MPDISIPCSRCGAVCKLAEKATDDARLLKYATAPETTGYCVNCGVAHFMQQQSMLGKLMMSNPIGKTMLLDPRVQQQFADILQTGNADAHGEDINWQQVHDHWELPFARSTKTRKKKQ